MATVDFNNAWSYGTGLDLVTGETRRNAVLFDPNQTAPARNFGGAGTRIIVDLKTVKSDVESAMTLNASTDISYGVFKASASLEMMSEMRSDRYTAWLTIVAYVTLDPLKIPNPALSDEAQAFLKANGSVAFTQRYGHCYVRAIQDGGSLFAILQIETSSQSERDTLKGKLTTSGALGSFSGSLSADIATSVATTLKTYQKKLIFSSTGGVADPSSISEDNILSAASAFVQSVNSANSTGQLALLEDYENLDAEFPSPTPKQIGLELARRANSFAAEIQPIRNVLDSLDYFVRHPELSDLPGDVLRKQSRDELTELTAWCSAQDQVLKDYSAAVAGSKDPLGIPPPQATENPPPFDLPTPIVRQAFQICSIDNRLAIGINSQGAISLVDVDEGDTTQRWLLPSAAGVVQIINADSKKRLVAEPGNLGRLLLIDPGVDVGDSFLFEYKPVGSAFGILLHHDTSLCISPLGLVAAGTLLAVQNWDGVCWVLKPVSLGRNAS